MTHDEKRKYLIEALLEEEPQYKNMAIPVPEQEQKNLLRALMNVRTPKPVGEEFLHIQNEYLIEEREASVIVDAGLLPVLEQDSRLVLWQGDMTSLKIDAIVNPANSAMLGCFIPLHSCADNMIHSKAGIELRLKCNEIMQKQGHEEQTGHAKITPGYNLPAKLVLHPVGPVIYGSVTEKERKQLASCYRSCLELAAENGVKSIAFCCISTGVFRFPNDEAAEIAVAAVKAFLQGDNRIEKVVFNVYKDTDLAIYRNLLGSNRVEQG